MWIFMFDKLSYVQDKLLRQIEQNKMWVNCGRLRQKLWKKLAKDMSQMTVLYINQSVHEREEKVPPPQPAQFVFLAEAYKTH